MLSLSQSLSLCEALLLLLVFTFKDSFQDLQRDFRLFDPKLAAAEFDYSIRKLWVVLNAQIDCLLNAPSISEFEQRIVSRRAFLHRLRCQLCNETQPLEEKLALIDLVLMVCGFRPVQRLTSAYSVEVKFIEVIDSICLFFRFLVLLEIFELESILALLLFRIHEVAQ